jgi:hypothetical protein
VHALSQQIPSTQKPVEHSEFFVHFWNEPSTFGVEPQLGAGVSATASTTGVPVSETIESVPASSQPVGFMVQTPTDPDTLHASHGPHAVAQHTPSAQWPVAHAPSEVHASPCFSLVTQLVPLQYAEASQSASLPHVVLHPVAPHP